MTEGPSASSAISAALVCNWRDAVRINAALLKQDGKNIDALNRLGYAYLKLGQFTQAKAAFQKVLQLDPYNQIAEKNLKKLTVIKRKDIDRGSRSHMAPLMFLQEPGKTKIVSCVNPAPAHILSTLSAGQEVFLKPKNHCVEIRNDKQVYLGALPDDLSFKLIKLMNAGNRYHSLVKGVGKNSLVVFLRELGRGKRFAHQPSFVATTSYVPFSRTNEAGVNRPDMTPTGEDSEATAGENSPEE